MSARTFERYRAPAGPELICRQGPAAGPATGPALLLLPPLFEEAHFTRTLLGVVLATLAAEGIRSWLPDLPGLGESEVPLAAVRLADWRAAAAAAFAHVAADAGAPPCVAAVRGGALLADLGDGPVWRLAPCDGAAVLRPLRRAQALAGSADMAGWLLPPALVADLEAAVPQPHPAAHDVAWPAGVPPWRRAEPAAPADAAAALAADLARWIAACAAR